MKNYIVIVTNRDGQVCYVIHENDIWRAAEQAVRECVNYSQVTRYESIELVEILNKFEQQGQFLNNMIQLNSGPQFLITICQR